MAMRVLVSTSAALGHLLPMVPLAKALSARGNEVLWAVPQNGVAEVERRGIRAVAAGSGEPPGPEAAFRDYPELRALAQEEVPDRMFAKLFGAIAAPRMLADLEPVALEWRPDLMVADAAELAGPIVGARLGVPWVTKGFGPLLPEPRVAAVAAEVAPLWRARGLDPRPYGGLYDHLYLDIYPPELASAPAPHVPRRQLMRPVADEDRLLEAGLPVPLPEGPSDMPLVYVTMGTIFNNPAPLRMVLDALDGLNIRVLVTVGPGGDPAVLGVNSARVRVERFVPQMLVLPRCDLVVSHGGSGTVLATLSLGLPQLCLPQGADQFLNSAAVASGGAGICLMPREASVTTVREAAVRLLAEKAFREAARRVSASIDSMPSPDEVAAVLETLP